MPGPARRRRPVPRGGRRQGHRRVLRPRQQPRRARGASGWATPSRPAARTATTTRRSASPPAARGRRCGTTSPSSASTCQTEPFTVVGIGDMSGDVFGNGMLPARATPARRRVRPPRHLPRPRPGPGGCVRRAPAPVRAARLVVAGLRPVADQPRRRGVLPVREAHRPRTARSRRVLRVPDASLTPAELIRAVLRAPVDLLFVGGIGTFVRATNEDDAPHRRPGQRRAAGRGVEPAGSGRGRGGEPRPSPSGPASSTPAAAGGSTWTPSTTRPASTRPTKR